MALAVLIAVSAGVCPALYVRNDDTTIEFAANSSTLSSAAQEELATLLAPVVGDELAEVSIVSHFPYRTTETDPPYVLAQTRSAEVRAAAIELGIAPDLVAGGQDVIGARYAGDGEWVQVPYTSEELNSVRIRYVVKSDCHPLADLVRRTKPYGQ